MILDVNNTHKAFGSSSPGDRGFTLLELMIVLSVMMVLLAIAIPAYHRHIIQTRETVLKANIIQLDKLIQQYTLDKRQAPQSLDDLKTNEYIHEIPKDPITGAADYDCDQEDPQNAADPQQPGITRCHSHSSGTSLEGEPYASW
jgi:general secretion pathway protein G